MRADLLESNIVSFNYEEAMFINIILELLDDFVFEADCEHDLEVAGSDTHVSEDIGEVSSIYQNDGLHIGGDFLLSIYFFT